MSSFPQPPAWVRERLRAGLVIPAHPLALTSTRRLDERHQRALSRYYHAAGTGGIAVGVHTTQFAIREPTVGLYEPVLQLAAETFAAADEHTGRQTVRVAGICGLTAQAVTEASYAREIGYHAGLLSLAALGDSSEAALVTHCENVAQVLPLFGFYLQPAVGGRVLSRRFWERFAEIPNVVGIKIAPFNRYQTLDVIRGVVAAGRAHDIALYTGNDDQILLDLLTGFVVPSESGDTRLRIVGGLLGQWAVWARRAVELLDDCRSLRGRDTIPSAHLTLAAQITDANAALFDAANNFAGCIPGLHEILRRQGLMAGIECLNPHERLSPGQASEIDRVCRLYPHLNDDEFVREHLDEWLR
ncbi:MAG TPA: dihydrodipicolinate synthase family protein [Verrucomicrobiota bacterium]|nr:dihydrodipicolinate synthase family protein [Verrucomicrobiales bacterium]HRI11680.1 dihydrodipicolinate synthase family protein [Verrucomicrobiota bacterium]